MTWSRNLRSGLHTRILSVLVLLLLCATSARAQSEVYRIVVQQGIPEKEAQDFKLHMEGLGYVPVILSEFTADGKASVFYGNFANKTEAEKARGELKRSNISAVAVVSVKRSAGEQSGGGSYTILVASMRQRSEADALSKKLGEAGHIGVKVVSQANVYHVTVGQYPSSDTARNVVASLKNEGHDKAAVVERNADGTLRVAPPSSGDGGGDVDISKIVGELGAQLSDKQKDEVARLIEEKIRLAGASGGGGMDQATAQRLRELETKLGSLDSKVQQVAAEVEAEKTRREAAARQTVEVGSMMRDGETLAKAGKYQEAIVKMDLILKLDPNNNMAIVRKQTFQDILDNGGVVGGTDTDGQYNRQKSEAVKLLAAGDRSSLQMAKTIWITIKGLNEKYSDEADAEIAKINTAIAALPADVPVAEGGSLAVIIAAGAAVLVLILGVVFFLRSRKERREILMKIQAATELRPTMKGIPGGRRASDWQLMAPEGADAPAAGPAMGGMAMGGMAMGPATGSMDDLFASGEGETDPLAGMGRAPAAAPPPPRPQTPLSTPAASDMGFDDILGGGAGGFDPGFGGFDSPSPAPARPAPAPPRPTPAPAMATGGGDLDDILAGLGGSAPAASPAASGGGDFSFGDIFAQPEAPPSKPVQRNAPSHADAGALSLDDLLGGGSQPAPAPAAANAFGGTPFDGLLGGAPQPVATQDIPALGFPDSAPLTGFGLGDETIIERPSLDFGGMGGGIGGGPRGAVAPVAEASVGANGEVYRQDFSADVPGMKPAGWQGDYAYARLVVENSTPPPGASNYLVYDKKDGVGKVYYSTRFPNVSGVVSVEFDLRCDDKNKFLLGFYVEKDEDFQQSIHTKILRSESQTAPSIHIHGQPAPYMLGAWARIKYVIDLNEGKVDGFVDDRHVARGVTLTQVPKYLNTLAIRDNINTTGKLFIGNVVVRKLG